MCFGIYMLINPWFLLSTGQLEELAVTTYQKYLLTIQSPLNGDHGIQMDEKNFTNTVCMVRRKFFSNKVKFLFYSRLYAKS